MGIMLFPAVSLTASEVKEIKVSVLDVARSGRSWISKKSISESSTVTVSA